jgi:hypothetical protein
MLVTFWALRLVYLLQMQALLEQWYQKWGNLSQAFFSKRSAPF